MPFRRAVEQYFSGRKADRGFRVGARPVGPESVELAASRAAPPVLAGADGRGPVVSLTRRLSSPVWSTMFANARASIVASESAETAPTSAGGWSVDDSAAWRRPVLNDRA